MVYLGAVMGHTTCLITAMNLQKLSGVLQSTIVVAYKHLLAYHLYLVMTDILTLL